MGDWRAKQRGARRQDATEASAGVLAAPQDLLTVHEDVDDTARISMWVGVGGVVDDLVRIESDDVRKVSPRDPAAPIQMEVRRGKAGQPADRLLERNDAFVSDVAPQQSRECAVRALVRVGFEEHAFRRGRRFVGAEAHPLDRDLAPNVVLRGDEVARADAALVFDDEIHRRLLGGSATDLCYVGERLSCERLECVALEGNEEDAVGAAGGDVEVLPVPSRRAHLVLDALAQGRFPKASEPRAKTARLYPRRHARVETGRTRGVRLYFVRYLYSSGPRALYSFYRRRDAHPV